MLNFWKNLKGPIFALAPMEAVSDTVFRELIASVSTRSYLNVLFTEFTSVDGLTSAKGFSNVSHRLFANDSELKLLKEKDIKLVAQIWGSDPEKFTKVARHISELKIFDGIDINMGCPVQKVVKHACCSALIKNPELAQSIIQATKEGTELPVSVKTRTGYNKIETERWIPQILKMQPAALTIHGRTQKQLSKGKANYEEIGKALAFTKKISPETKILGNGDIESYAQGLEKIETYGLHGIMVGRGIFKNPYLFNKENRVFNIDENLQLLIQHVRSFEKTWGNSKNYNILKRFYKIYINNFSGASQMRAQLMETNSYEDFYNFINTKQRSSHEL